MSHPPVKFVLLVKLYPIEKRDILTFFNNFSTTYDWIFLSFNFNSLYKITLFFNKKGIQKNRRKVGRTFSNSIFRINF